MPLYVRLIAAGACAGNIAAFLLYPYVFRRWGLRRAGQLLALVSAVDAALIVTLAVFYPEEFFRAVDRMPAGPAT